MSQLRNMPPLSKSLFEGALQQLFLANRFPSPPQSVARPFFCFFDLQSSVGQPLVVSIGLGI